MSNLATIVNNILADSGIDDISVVIGSGTSGYIPVFTATGRTIGDSVINQSGGNVLIGGNIALHAGNFNSYAPTLGGVGASGTWGISITGNADTVDGYHMNQNLLTSSSPTFAGLTSNGSITVNGIGIFNSSSDHQISLRSPDAWTGIEFDDSAGGLDYIWFNGLYQTFAIGGGGSSVLGKKLHIDGGTTIGVNYDSTSVPTNGLNVEGPIQQAGNQVLHAGNFNSYAPTLTGGGASGTWGINITGNSATVSTLAALGSPISYNNDRTTKISNGLAIYSAYLGGSNSPWTYDIAAQFVTGSRGMEFSASWTSPSQSLKFRTLRDCCDPWSAWVDILTSANYNSYSPSLSGSGATGTWGINITGSSGSAGSASSVPWTGVSAGIRENYDLQFRPADNSSSYAGFSFASPGNSQNAGYFLVRGGGDSDVYTQNGITLVADLGWLTLAQRTASDKGVRIMTGTTSVVRAEFTSAGAINFNSALTTTTRTGGLRVTSSGTATTQAAIALQQVTAEGDTIIFADYEPFAEYGIIARNSLDSIDFTSGTTTNSIDSYNITNRTGDARTAYVKARIGLASGVSQISRITNVGLLGSNSGNARNHFTQLNSGTTSPSGGWIAAAFGDATNNRVVIGQWSGNTGAIIGSHTGSLNDWAGMSYVATTHQFYANADYTGAVSMLLDSSHNLIVGRGSVRAPIFYDSNDTSYYLDPSEPNTSLSIVGGVNQRNLVGRPNVIWGSTYATGPVVIKFPGDSSNYGMIHAVIDIYEYNGNNVSTVIIGGHNWAGGWYNYGANIVGYTNKPVRLAFKDGKYAIVIGDSSSVWDYGQVVLRKIQNGTYYQNVMNVTAGYTIGIESDSGYGFDSGDIAQMKTKNQYGVQNAWSTGTFNGGGINGYTTSGCYCSWSLGTCGFFQSAPGGLYASLSPYGLTVSPFNGECMYYNVFDSNLYIGGNICQNWYSDCKYKENITEIDSALDKIDALRGVEFDWNELGEEEVFKKGHEVGLIAQEVQAVYPQAVREVSKEREDHVVTALVVDYDKFTPLLIQSIKELKAQVDTLKSRMDASGL